MRSLVAVALLSITLSVPALAETNSSRHIRPWMPAQKTADLPWHDPYANIAKERHDAWVAAHRKTPYRAKKNAAGTPAAAEKKSGSWWSRNFGDKK